MANYKQVGYGSKGSDVTELQKLLNQNGYNLTEDGIFGKNTQSAVKDYQKKNNLSVDGIVGTNTWGALTKASSSANTGTTGTTGNTTTATTDETQDSTFKYTPYTPSDTVKQAEELLNQQLANKPSDYTSSWQSQLDTIIQQIQNREEFSYDLNADALYQQYKDQYVTQGNMAMMDTMGQAQAMTGGYGNSYAQTAGQQAYQSYLQGLNDKIPELYELALSKYNSEGDDLYNMASLISGMEEQDYSRYRDTVSDYYTELDRLTGDYEYKSEQDYNQWSDDTSFLYQQERDKVSDQQWQDEFDEAVRQYDESNSSTSTSSSGSSSGGGGGKKGYDNGGYSDSIVKQAQAFVGASTDGKWGSNSAAAAKKKGYNSIAEVVAAMGGAPADGGGFTGSTYSEATAYIKSNGGSASGLMTSTEWARHKNSLATTGQGNAEVKNYSSYQEYLRAYVEYATE